MELSKKSVQNKDTLPAEASQTAGTKRKPDHALINGQKLVETMNKNSTIQAPKKIKIDIPSNSNGKSKFIRDEELPISAFREQIIRSVVQFQTTICVGETGSGKSTQLAQYLADSHLSGNTHEKKKYSIVCTQPRRVAAITIAQRVALERNGLIGDEVGYSIRFEDKTSHKTRIKYVTDGVLLRECMSDTTLSKYDVIILDESHERSLQTDILMGLLKLIQEQRPALRIVVMSATLEVDLFMRFFSNCNYIQIPGRQFPVDIYYTKEPEEDFADAALLTILQIHEEEEEGGVLVFLPGQEEIVNLINMLNEHLPTIKAKKMAKMTSMQSTENQFNDYKIFPLYAALGQEEQLHAFRPTTPGVRKIVVATNIAETSLTISGIKYVVDTGFNKARSVNPTTGMESLRVSPVSQSQANQRAGRAGRESAGKCFRLYCEDAFEGLDVSTVPEIKRMNITQVVLQLKVMGVQDPLAFPFPSPPNPDSVTRAVSHLFALGALDKEQKLTEHGIKLSKLPLEPTLAHTVIRAVEYGCVEEAVVAVAVLSSENIFMQPHQDEEKQRAAHAHKQFSSRAGDLLALVNIYFTWQKANRDKEWTRKHYLNHRSLLHSADVARQLSALLLSQHIDPNVSCRPDMVNFQKCIAAGFFLNVAKKVVTSTFVKGNSGKNGYISNSMKSGSMQQQQTAPYKTVVGGQFVHIHPSSVMFSLSGGEKKLPEYVCYAELLVTTKQYMRCITAVEEAWLMEVAPMFYKK